MATTVNLGQVSSIHIGTSAPDNTNLQWCDITNPLSPVWKTYVNGVWQTATGDSVWINTNPVADGFGGYVVGEPATPPEGLNLQQALDKLLVSEKPPTINYFVAGPPVLGYNQDSASVVLSWSVAPFNVLSTIDAITIERRRGGSGAWTTIYSSGGGTTYTDAGIPYSSGQVINYRLTVLASNSQSSVELTNVSYAGFVQPSAASTLNGNMSTYLEEIGRTDFAISVTITNPNTSATITALRLYRSTNAGAFVLIESITPGSVNYVYTKNQTFSTGTYYSSLVYKVEIDTAGGTTTFVGPTCVFINKVYAGNLSTTSPTESVIEALSTVNGLYSALPTEFNFSAVTGYKGIFYPTSITAPTSYRQTTIDGIPFAMRARATFSITNQYGHVSSYYGDITENIFNGSVKILPKYS